MDTSEEVSKSLIKWLQTLNPEGTKSLEEISDGVAIYQILLQIAPDHFNVLESKIVAKNCSNWRLKVSNLKKIVESLIEYYHDILNLSIHEIGKPDVMKIAETSNFIQLGKLLRLVLGCAVHCEKKQEYITQIMGLEESVQRCIMQAIQDLEEITGNTGRTGFSLLSMENETRIFKLVQDLEAANDSKEVISQHCHDLEMQVQCLLEEKQTLMIDNQLLSNQLKEHESSETIRNPDNRRQVDLLEEEIFKLETSRDDYKAKMLEQEKQISMLQEKMSELQLAADAAVHLKDEVDALSESAGKVEALEHTVTSYKKKLEDYGDLKKQLKYLEEKTMEYYQQNLKYEEELKASAVWKNQLEIYKKQAAELQQKLDEEIQRSDRAVFQFKNHEMKLTATISEKERIIQERDLLRDELEELKLDKRIYYEINDGADVARELAPTEIKERLRFLEKENQALISANQEVTAKQVLLNDALSRVDKLTEQNRTLNQRMLELESQLQDQQKCLTDNSSKENIHKECKQKIASIQDVLLNKENEIQAMQAKYVRNLEKAKEVIQNLDRKPEDIDHIRQNPMKESEDQMLVTAFHRLSLTRHREAVDEKLAILGAGQGQSFLARQRQPTPRKCVQPFKSK